jgi:molybdate transport system regulatory protein
VRLLEAIDLYGSISQAAKHVPLSYKAAWDAVDAMNNPPTAAGRLAPAGAPAGAHA